MATLVQNHLGLIDLFKRQDKKGNVIDVLQILNQAQEVTKDIPWMECNQGVGHLHAIQSGLGSVSWGALYEGIAQSKSDVQQVTDTTGFVEAACSVDVRLLDLAGGNRGAVRISESKPKIEKMGQECATALFYHDPANNIRYPKGLGARYGSLATSGAGNQIVDGGGTGSDNTSIWMVTWGENSVFGLYPEGTSAGLKQEDKGQQRVLDPAGNAYYVEEEEFRWHMGFGVKDYRMVSRIANVDISDIAAGTVDLYGLMRKAYYKLHSRRIGKIDNQVSPGRTVIYCNTDVLEALDGLATNSGSSDNYTRLRPMEIEGEEVDTYRKIPIRETDALVNTEARVV